MSKRKLIEQMKVKNPCSESWDEMTGNDEVRFCGHCNLNVNNLSAMTRRQALKIMRRTEGGICVRYVENPFDKKPVFADKLYQITRRAGVAAGVLGASLTLSTVSYAQGGTIKVPVNDSSSAFIVLPENQNERENETAPAAVAGTVTDSAGGFAAGVSVYLFDHSTGESFREITGTEGFYKFEIVRQGNYKLVINDEKGSAEVSRLEVSPASENRQDIALTIPTLAEVAVDLPEQSVEISISGGIGISVNYEHPLTKAVWDEDEVAVENLIVKGANVDLREQAGDNITPLFIAVETGNLKIAQMLLNFGADINARDEQGKTPLMHLDEDAGGELVRLLIKYGADVNAVDNMGNTALISAAAGYAGAEVLQALIENGADVNLQNKDGKTALMEAAYEDDFENVKTLVLGGADVNLKNKNGDAALDLTSDENAEFILKSYGAVEKDN